MREGININEHSLSRSEQMTFPTISPYSYTNIFANGSYGVCHTDELIYMWEPLFEHARETWFGPLSGNDLVMREMMLSTWTNFAIYGDPTPPNSGLH